MPKLFYFLSITLLLSINSIFPQISISGSIIDTSMNPVKNALVEIIEYGDRFNTYQGYSDESGNFIISKIVSDIDITRSKIPESHLLLRNYPNPFNPSTIIYFELTKREKVILKIYDILGREIITLFNGIKNAGIHQLLWNGDNNFGNPVSAGIYFCRLITEQNEFKVHKMVLLDGGVFHPQIHSSVLAKKVAITNDKEEFKFRFSIRVTHKNINPIILSNLVCNSDTTLELVATLPFIDNIGVEGGVISNGEVYINIPPGSISEASEIRFYYYPPEENLFDRSITNVYRIEGLPLEFNNPIKIGMKYEGELIENSIIDIGFNEYIPELNDSLIMFIPHLAIDSAGYLWTTYPNLNEGLNAISKISSRAESSYTVPQKYLHLVGKTGRKWLETDNFYGNIPEIAWNTPILNYLEISYAKFKTMGFTFQPDETKLGNNRANVIICDVGTIFSGPEDGDIFGNGQAYISADFSQPPILYRYINVDFFWWVLLDDYPFKHRLQAISGIVLFDALARVYDTQEQFDHRSTECERYWFHKASSFWSGELFTTEENYIAPGFKGNELAPFNGMVAGACNGEDREIRMHGYGMTSLVKYLMEKAESEGRFNTFLIDVYKNIFSDKNPVSAINTNMKVPLEVWWPNYFKEYIAGKIYDVSSSTFLNAPNEILLKIGINDNTKSNAVISRDYKDLSAKLFQFNFNYNETNETNELQLKSTYQLLTEATPTTLVFGLSDDKLEYIKGGIGTISCNIKEMQTKGYKTLLAAVVNNFYNPLTFSDNSIIDLSVKTKDKDSLNFTIVKIKTLAKYKYNTGETYDGSYLYNPGAGDAHYGTFENGKFESDWLEEYGGGVSKGKIEINIDLISGIPKITRFYVKETDISSDIERNTIEGIGIELYGYRRTIGGYEFYINGKETCSNITSIENVYQGDGGYGWQVTEKSCDDDSYIQIIIGSD